MADKFDPNKITDSPATAGWGARNVTPEMQRQNPVWRFLEETYPGQHMETGLIEYTIDDEAAISLVPTSPKTMKIDSLRALKKNTGAGTRALNLLSRQADKYGVTLEGLVHKFEEEGLSKADLVKFYQKAGWELRYPDKVERSLSEGKALEDIRVEMLRSPRPTEQATVPETSADPSSFSPLMRERLSRMTRERLAQLQRGEYFPTTQEPEDVPPQTSSERLIKLRQAAEMELPEEGAAAEALPTTPLAPRPNLPAVVQKQSGIEKLPAFLRNRAWFIRALAEGADQFKKNYPEEAAEIQEFMNRPVHDVVGLEEPLGETVLEFIERQFGAREPEQEPTGIATLDLSMEPEIVAQRASDQGFTLDAYHFTPSPEDFEEFIPGGPAFEVDEKGNFDVYGSNQLSGPATWFSATPEGLRSAGFRGSVDDVMPEGSRVLPVKIRVENPLYIDALNREEMADRFFTKDLDSMYSLRSEFPWLLNQPTVDKLREVGFDTIIMSSPDADPEGMIFPEKSDPMAEYIVLDNRNIRSKFARFDPAQSKEAGLNKAAGGLVQGPLSVNPDMSKVSAGFIDKPLYDRFL